MADNNILEYKLIKFIGIIYVTQEIYKNSKLEIATDKLPTKFVPGIRQRLFTIELICLNEITLKIDYLFSVYACLFQFPNIKLFKYLLISRNNSVEFRHVQ